MEVDYTRLNSEQRNFVDDLRHATIPEIVRSEDVQKMIEDGVFLNIDSYFDMKKDASKFLPNTCNESCKIHTGRIENRCRKWNNRLKTKDNNKKTLKKFSK